MKDGCEKGVSRFKGTTAIHPHTHRILIQFARQNQLDCAAYKTRRRDRMKAIEAKLAARGCKIKRFTEYLSTVPADMEEGYNSLRCSKAN